MKLLILESETKFGLGFNRKLLISYTDLISWLGSGSPLTSGTAQAIVPSNTLGSTTNQTPVPTIFGNFALNLVTPFTSSGGAITHLYLSMGDAGSATRFLAASTFDLAGSAGWLQGTFTRYMETAAANLLAVFTISGQTMASLNAGLVELYFYQEDASRLTQVL